MICKGQKSGNGKLRRKKGLACAQREIPGRPGDWLGIIAADMDCWYVTSPSAVCAGARRRMVHGQRERAMASGRVATGRDHEIESGWARSLLHGYVANRTLGIEGSTRAHHRFSHNALLVQSFPQPVLRRPEYFAYQDRFSHPLAARLVLNQIPPRPLPHPNPHPDNIPTPSPTTPARQDEVPLPARCLWQRQGPLMIDTPNPPIPPFPGKHPPPKSPS